MFACPTQITGKCTSVECSHHSKCQCALTVSLVCIKPLPTIEQQINEAVQLEQLAKGTEQQHHADHIQGYRAVGTGEHSQAGQRGVLPFYLVE